VGFSEGRARLHSIPPAFEVTLFSSGSDPAALPCDKLPCVMRVESVLYGVRFLDGITAVQRSDCGFDCGSVLSGVGNASCGRYLI
jgi:hypothetical protein